MAAVRPRPESPAVSVRPVLLLAASLAAPAVAADDPRTLTGTVTDAAGVPVAGAVVRPQRDGTGEPTPDPVTTDADGRFALTYVERPSRPAVFVTHPDGPAAGFLAAEPDPPPGAPRGFNARSAEPWPPLTVALRPGRAVNFAVTDAAGGPVAGAAVELLAGRYGLTSTATGRTDAAGAATLFATAGSGELTAIAVKDGPGPAAGLDAAVLQPADDGEDAGPLAAPLTLGGAVAATFTAVDPHWEPVPGVVLSSWILDRAAGAPGGGASINLGSAETLRRTTGPDGTATVAYLPADAGLVSFTAESDTHHAPDAAAVSVDEPAATVRMVPFTTLSGRATDAAGAPAAGVVIHLEGRGAQMYHRSYVVTGPDGRWSDRVPTAQLYTAAVEDPDRAAAVQIVAVPGLAPSGKALTDPDAPNVSPGGAGTVEPVTGLDFALGPGVLLSGTVRQAGGGDEPGEPAAGVTVLVELVHDGVTVPGITDRHGRSDPGPGWVGPEALIWRETGADGRYEVRLGPGEWALSPDYKGRETITVAPGDAPDRTLDLTLPPRPKAFDLTVAVVDAAGEPVPGAPIEGTYVGDFDPTFHGDGPAGADGTRTVERTDVPLLLAAFAPGRTAAGWADVPADATAARVTLLPAGAVGGRLVDLENRPIMGARVTATLRVFGNAEGTISTQMFGVTAATGPDGRFLIAGLPTGRELVVSVWDPRRAWGESANLQAATPAAGAVAESRPVYLTGPAAAPELRDVRAEFTPEVIGEVADRVRFAFARDPAADARLPALFAAAAAENKKVLAVLADPADAATAGLWELFAADERARDAAGRGFVTIYRATGRPGGEDPRAVWGVDELLGVSAESPGPVLAVLGRSPDGGVRAVAAVSLAGRPPARARAVVRGFLRRHAAGG